MQTATETLTGKPRALDAQLRRQMLAKLGRVREARLTITDSIGSVTVGEDQGELHANVRINNLRFYRTIVFGGSNGVAEAYLRGYWETDDLTALVRVFVRNRDLLDAMEGGWASAGSYLLRVWHQLNRNSLTGSRRNIAAHYDLGNDFFKLFLDAHMMYSSAIFDDPDESLETASTRKLETICRKLDLKPSDHLLEIGSGWGGFAVYAAKHYGCRVSTCTISQEQYRLARERVAEADLQDRVTVLLKDYRHLDGQYDKLVSIEMVEAVGHQYLDGYFDACSRLLKDDGVMLLQAITLEDHRYRQSLQSVDYIKRYIFPGSFIPCVSILSASAGAAKLRLVNLQDIGHSYAITLKRWRQKFQQRLAEVSRMGYDRRFIRMWIFYLCYCEGGFIERSISDVQMLFSKPGNRHQVWPSCAM